MTGKLRQMLVDKSALEEIRVAKMMMESSTGKRVTSRDVIEEFVGKRVRFLNLRREIRSYINGFVDRVVRNENVIGVMLFGSVARGSYKKESDVDVLLAVRGDVMDAIEEIEKTIDEVEELRTPLVADGFYLRIRPLILSKADLKAFRPIYLNIIGEGIVLFERGESLTNFIGDVKRNVEWRKEIIEDGLVIRWKIRA